MLFAGDYIFKMDIKEDEEFYIYDADNNFIGYTNKCVLYTMIFHAFVFMQVFNEINSRKLGDKDFNVFKGFFNNWLFLFIILLTIGVQILMVQYGGLPVRCAPLN